MTTQQSLTRLDVALTMGQYDFGSAKTPDRRNNNVPFSALTFRESDLSRLRSRLSSQGKSRLDDPIHVKSVSKEQIIRHNRPDSMMSLMSLNSPATERLLSAVSDRPRLLRRDQSARASYYGQNGAYQPYRAEVENSEHVGNTDVIVGRVDSKGRKFISADEVEERDLSQTEPEIVQGGFEDCQVYSQDRNAATHGNEGNVISVDLQRLNNEEEVEMSNGDGEKQIKSVTLRPSSAPRRMFERFGGVTPDMSGPSRQSMSSYRKLNSAHSSKRAWSGRSVTSASSSRRPVPGKHDVTLGNSRSISGPNSSLQSLLGQTNSPRSASVVMHHRSAWYHVPGRYVTPKVRYPSKRMQKTENARDIEAFLALKSQWARKKHHDLIQEKLKELQLEEQKNPKGPYRTNFVESINKHIAANIPSQARRLPKYNATPRLMISGLDMVPESRYPEDISGDIRNDVSGPTNPVVKFKEPIVCG